MLTLPVYTRAGVFYLHTRVGKKQFKRSLGTRDPVLAKLRALDILRAIHMTKPKISDFNFDHEKLRHYELDLSKGIARSDGPDDHARMLEAIKCLTPLYQSNPPTPKLGGVNELNSLSSSSAGGVDAPQAGLRVLEVLDKMLTLRKNLSQATVLSYKNTVQEFSKFTKNPVFSTLGISDITRYQEFLINFIQGFFFFCLTGSNFGSKILLFFIVNSYQVFDLKGVFGRGNFLPPSPPACQGPRDARAFLFAPGPRIHAGFAVQGFLCRRAMHRPEGLFEPIFRPVLSSD